MTDKQPTTEQMQKFWEWCGIKQVNVHCGTKDILGQLADGSHLEVQDLNGFNIGVFPPIDLNNLFKYAVPKMWILKIELIEAIFWLVTASCPDVHGVGKHGAGKVLCKDPAIALFWAIWEVIKGTK